MLQLKIGIQLASLREPFKKALLTAARLGADGVEIEARGDLAPRKISQSGIRQLRKMLDDLNLRVSAVAFPTRRGYNVLDQLDHRVEATKEALQLAYALGAPVVVNQIGRIPDEPEGKDWDLLISSLTDIGRFSQRAGAFLAAETGSEDAPVLRQLLDALPDGSLAVDFNPGNLLINGFSPSAAARLLGPDVMHVHAKDAVRDLARGRGLETLVGRGSVDFPELIGVLEEHGYRGFFTVERERAEDPAGEIGNAISYLRSLLD